MSRAAFCWFKLRGRDGDVEEQVVLVGLLLSVGRVSQCVERRDSGRLLAISKTAAPRRQQGLCLPRCIKHLGCLRSGQCLLA